VNLEQRRPARPEVAARGGAGVGTVAPRAAGASVPGLPALTAPLATLAAAVIAAGVLAVRDPEQPGHYPTCPFHAMTGLWCPGCGSLRAVHALTHGDLSTAVHRNALAVLALPYLAAAWLAWLTRTLGRPRTTRATPPAALWAVLAVVITFGVARNLAPTDWLAP
jgi:Protein of unknown function (DUF2752)